MPIYRVQGPDGRIYEVDGPPGVPEAALFDYVRRQILTQPAAANVPPPESGFVPALKSGVSELKSGLAALAGRTGIMNEGAAEQYIKEQEEYQKRTFKPTETFGEAPVTKTLELLGGSAPYIAAPVLAGGAAALAVPAGAAAIPVIGGVTLGTAIAGGAAGLASATQFTGSNLRRQMEEGKKLGETDIGAAAAAALPQAALDMVSFKMLPGIRTIFKEAGKEIAPAAAKKIAEQGIKEIAKDYAISTGKAMGTEALTEAGQQVLERMQAGLSLTDEKARDEYFDSMLGGAVLGGVLSPAGRYIERRGENKQQREEALAEARKLQEEQDKQRAAQEEYRKTPAGMQEFAQNYVNLKQLADELDAERGKIDKKSSPEARAQYDELTTALAEVNKKLKKDADKYNQVTKELQKLRVNDPEAEARMAAMEQQVAGEQPTAGGVNYDYQQRGAAPDLFQTQLELPGGLPSGAPPAAEAVIQDLQQKLEAAQASGDTELADSLSAQLESLGAPPDVARQKYELDREKLLLTNRRDELKARSQQAGTVTEAMKLAEQMQQTEFALAQVNKKLREQQAPGSAVEALLKKMAQARKAGDAELIQKIGAQLQALGVEDLAPKTVTQMPQQEEFPLFPAGGKSETSAEFEQRVTIPAQREAAAAQARQEAVGKETEALKRIGERPLPKPKDADAERALAINDLFNPSPVPPVGRMVLGESQTLANLGALRGQLALAQVTGDKQRVTDLRRQMNAISSSEVEAALADQAAEIAALNKPEGREMPSRLAQKTKVTGVEGQQSLDAKRANEVSNIAAQQDATYGELTDFLTRVREADQTKHEGQEEALSRRALELRDGVAGLALEEINARRALVGAPRLSTEQQLAILGQLQKPLAELVRRGARVFYDMQEVGEQGQMRGSRVVRGAGETPGRQQAQRVNTPFDATRNAISSQIDKLLGQNFKVMGEAKAKLDAARAKLVSDDPAARLQGQEELTNLIQLDPQFQAAESVRRQLAGLAKQLDTVQEKRREFLRRKMRYPERDNQGEFLFGDFKTASETIREQIRKIVEGVGKLPSERPAPKNLAELKQREKEGNKQSIANKFKEAYARVDADSTVGSPEPISSESKNDETKTKYRATYNGSPAVLTVIRDDAGVVQDVNVKIDGEKFNAVNFGKQGVVPDAKLLDNLKEVTDGDLAYAASTGSSGTVRTLELLEQAFDSLSEEGKALALEQVDRVIDRRGLDVPAQLQQELADIARARQNEEGQQDLFTGNDARGAVRATPENFLRYLDSKEVQQKKERIVRAAQRAKDAAAKAEEHAKKVAEELAAKKTPVQEAREKAHAADKAARPFVAAANRIRRERKETMERVRDLVKKAWAAVAMATESRDEIADLYDDLVRRAGAGAETFSVDLKTFSDGLADATAAEKRARNAAMKAARAFHAWMRLSSSELFRLTTEPGTAGAKSGKIRTLARAEELKAAMERTKEKLAAAVVTREKAQKQLEVFAKLVGTSPETKAAPNDTVLRKLGFFADALAKATAAVRTAEANMETAITEEAETLSSLMTNAADNATLEAERAAVQTREDARAAYEQALSAETTARNDAQAAAEAAKRKPVEPKLADITERLKDLTVTRVVRNYADPAFSAKLANARLQLAQAESAHSNAMAAKLANDTASENGTEEAKAAAKKERSNIAKRVRATLKLLEQRQIAVYTITEEAPMLRIDSLTESQLRSQLAMQQAVSETAKKTYEQFAEFQRAAANATQEQITALQAAQDEKAKDSVQLMYLEAVGRAEEDIKALTAAEKATREAAKKTAKERDEAEQRMLADFRKAAGLPEPKMAERRTVASVKDAKTGRVETQYKQESVAAQEKRFEEEQKTGDYPARTFELIVTKKAELREVERILKFIDENKAPPRSAVRKRQVEREAALKAQKRLLVKAIKSLEADYRSELGAAKQEEKGKQALRTERNVILKPEKEKGVLDEPEVASAREGDILIDPTDGDMDALPIDAIPGEDIYATPKAGAKAPSQEAIRAKRTVKPFAWLRATPESGASLAEKFGVGLDESSPINGVTFAEAARFGARRSTSPVAKVLFTRLAEMFESLPADVQGMVFAVDGPMTSASGRSVAGLYIGTKRAVLTPSSKANSSANGILLHELTHAATVLGLNTNRELDGRVSELRQRVIDWLETKEGKAYFRKHSMELGRSRTSIYGLTNNKEFLAEVFANRGFQKMLTAIPSDKPRKSIFTRLVEAVANFFRGDTDIGASAFAEAMALSEEAVEATRKQLAGGTTDKDSAALTETNIDDGDPMLSRDAVYLDDSDMRRVGAQVSKFVAKKRGIWDSIKANATGLAFETQLVDRFAGLERIRKYMGALAGTQMMYFLRMYDQRMHFVSQSVMRGAPELVAKTRADGQKEFVIEAKDGPNLSNVVNTLSGAQKYVGNAEAVNQMFTGYLAALRAQRVGLEALNFGPDVTQAMLDDIVATVEANDALKKIFEKARNEYNAYNRNLMQFMADTGALSKDLAKQLSATNDYIPYYREQNGNAVLIIGGESPIKVGSISSQPYLRELMGGDTAILDFMTSSVQNTNMLVDMALRNQATKNVAYELQKIGAAKFVGKGREGPDVVSFKEDGVDKYVALDTEEVTVGGKRFATGIPAELIVKGMEGIPTQMTGLMRAMALPSQLLRKTVTLSPLYMARQLFRDSLAAPILTGANFTPVFGAIRTLRGEVGDTLERRGITGGQYMTGTTEDITKILRDLSDGKSGFMAGISKLEALGMEADALTRRAQYNSYIKQGLSEMEATLMSLESMNFNKRGASPSVHIANAMIPFFNAQIQGLNVLYKAFTGKMPFNDQLKIRQKLLQRGAMLAAGTILYAMLMEDDEAYKEALPDQKYGNWFVRVPGVDEPLRLPVPFEVGYIFKALPEALYNSMTKDDGAQEAVKALRQILINTIPGGSSMPTIGGVPVPTPIPQIMKPAIEAGLGKSFFTGRDILSAREKELPPEEQFRANTSEVAKIFGNMTGASPILFENLVRGYTGTLGVAFLQALSLGAPKSESPEAAAKRLSEYPIIGGAFQPNDAGGMINTMYERFNDAQKIRSSFAKKIEEGRVADAESTVMRYANELMEAEVGDKFKTNMNKLTQIESAIRASDMSAEEKRKQLNEVSKLKTAIARTYREALP